MKPVRAKTESHLIGLRISQVMTPQKPVKPVGIPLRKVTEELQDPPVPRPEPCLTPDDLGQALSLSERQDSLHLFAESNPQLSHGRQRSLPEGYDSDRSRC